MSQYAISDIHGCLKTFKFLLKRVNFSKKDELYILGDIVDRGPESKGVIDYIWTLQTAGYTVNCLKGNHDQMMVDARINPESQRLWLRHGGLTTLYNFNAFSIQDIPSKYFSFLESLPSYIEVGKYILVHAGFKFEMSNPLEEFDAMLWQRAWYDNINYHWLKDRVIVHGHTPVSKSDISAMLKNINQNQYIDIDSGCVHKGKREGLGYLACFILNDNRLVFEANCDF